MQYGHCPNSRIKGHRNLENPIPEIRVVKLDRFRVRPIAGKYAGSWRSGNSSQSAACKTLAASVT
jgi:hypothetical protein